MVIFKNQCTNSKKQAKSYHLGRACLYCGEPIEDQARASKLHCQPWSDEYGVRHDCKRKRHQDKHQKNDGILLDMNANQREIARQIERMLKTHGDEVSTDVIDAYGINLFDSIEFDLNPKEGKAVFLGYKIVTSSSTQIHKIIKL